MLASVAFAAALVSGAPASPSTVLAAVRGVEACFEKQFPAFQPAGYDRSAFLTAHGFRRLGVRGPETWWQWSGAEADVKLVESTGCHLLISDGRLTHDVLLSALAKWGEQVGFTQGVGTPWATTFELRVQGSVPSTCGPGTRRGGSLHLFDVEPVDDLGWVISFRKTFWCD